MNGEDILKAVFEAPEENVEVFFSVLADKITDPNKDDSSRIINAANGVADQIAAPELVETKSGWIRMLHGYHSEDYVWHISPWHEKKPWRVSRERLLYAIAQCMNNIIPTTIDVRIWLPKHDWEIPEYTFKAMALKSCWNVNEDQLAKLNENLFIVLNTLV